MQSGSNSRVAFFSILGITFVYHCFTLNLFPLPWFDEVHFAGISKSLAEAGNLKSHFLTFTKGNENSLSYGPVFFAIQAISIKLLGFNIYSTRLPTLLFGYLSIIMVYLIGIRVSKSYTKSSLVSSIFIIDLFYSTNMHEARMETLITCLFLTGLLILLKENLTQTKKVITTAIIAVTCFSTSPRSFVLILPLVALLMYQTTEKHINMMALFFTIFLGFYSIWILFAFDGFQEWIQHYLNVIKGNKTAVNGYLGGNFYIPSSQYILIGTLLCLIYLNKTKLKTPTKFVLIATIIIFYSTVYDWGNYSSLILPSFYLLIILLIEKVSLHKTFFYLAPLIVFNVFFFSIKSTSIILEQENRNHHKIATELKQIVPKKSKVIGDDIMLYVAEQNNWNFQVFTHYKELNEREKSLRENFKFEYLIISKQFLKKKKQEVDYFIKKNQLTMIHKKELEPHSINFLLQKIHLSTMEKYGYSYYLYQRKP